MYKTFKMVSIITVLVAAASALPAEAKKRSAAQDVNAARQECMEKAQAAANVNPFAEIGEKNAMGVDFYRRCAREKGIKP